MRTRLFVAAIATFALIGCGKSEEQKAAEATAAAAQQIAKDANAAAAGAQTMAQGAAALAQAMQAGQITGPDGKPLPPVDFEKLEELLPTVSGWDKGKPKGQQTTMPSMSTVDVRYTKSGERVKLAIADAVLARAMFLPYMTFFGSGYSARDSYGNTTKSAPIGGFPSFERWNSERKTGEIVIIVANRFMVHGEGSALSGIDAVRTIVSAVDLAKLATLK